MGNNARRNPRAKDAIDQLDFGAIKAQERLQPLIPGAKIRVGIIDQRGEKAVKGFIVTVPNDEAKKRLEQGLKANGDTYASVRTYLRVAKVDIRVAAPH